MSLSTDPWTWIAAAMTLAIFSFLYKDNPFYRFAEHLFVGVSVGYTLAVLYDRVFLPKVWTPLAVEHRWIMIPPTLLGILYISFFFPKKAWIARYPISFMMGLSAGLALPLTMSTDILIQAQGTFAEPAPGGGIQPVLNVAKFQAFLAHPSVLSFVEALYGPLLIIGVFCVMISKSMAVKSRLYISNS